jgi:RNA polymerase sigma-70 factor (ECF subfamily)
MVAPDDTVTQLMTRLRAGEQTAAQEVFDRFARRLVGLARRQFHPLLAHRVDPEDVVQSAYKSFFARHQAGQLAVDTWNGLWKLLTIITLRKCADRAEYFRAGRRNVARESGQVAGDGPEPWMAALDREPRPEEAAILAETVEQLFHSVDADERPILELSLKGYTVPEIGARLGRPERSVRRLRERIRKRLERMRADE